MFPYRYRVLVLLSSLSHLGDNYVLKKKLQSNLTFGTDDFAEDEKHTVWYMVSAPFRK